MSKPAFEDIFTFSGRRNRKSYIYYTLLLIPIVIVIALIGAATAGIGLVLLLPVIVSGWAVGAQRCRDFGWTGWAILISAIPFVGGLFAIAMFFIPGNVGENRYGPDPLSSGPLGAMA